MLCERCNKELPDNAAFCGFCGSAMSGDTTSTDVVNQDTDSTDLLLTETVNEEVAGNEPEIEKVEPEIIQPEDQLVNTIQEDSSNNDIVNETETQNEFASYSHSPKEAIEENVQTAPDKVVKTSVYFFMMLAMLVPGLNIIMLLTWSFSEKLNPNSRNFARAALMWLSIGIVLCIIALIVFIISFLSYSAYMDMPFLYFEY